MNNSSIHCPKCGSNNVTIQLIQEQKKRGCLTSIMILLVKIVLFFINLIIWVISLLIPKGHKTKTNKYAVCQNCGHTWKI